MFNKYIFFLLSIFGLCSFFFASDLFFKKHLCKQYPSIEYYREVKDVFDSCDQQTLVVFDIDQTLITGVDALVARDGEYPFWFKICAAFKYPSLIFNREKLELIGSIIFQQEHFVFDPDIVRFIQQLHRQKCPVVALTWARSGSYGIIKSMPEWRAAMLQHLGFYFQGQFQDMSFKMFPKYHNCVPRLYKGILCANRQPKGAVLGAFLDACHLKPTRIIFFDDSPHFLDSVADECAKRKIDFVGYKITGAQKYMKIWNTRRALLQIDYVMKHERWLPDKQADALLLPQKVAY